MTSNMTIHPLGSNNKYWAQRRNRKLGPFNSVEEAVRSGYSLFPKQKTYNDAFYIGYGEFGPHFNIKFISRLYAK